MYSPAADAIALTAGGVEGIRFTEASSSVIQTHEANTGLTADVGSAQGNGVITSTYNVYSTVGTAGDAATLPATFPVGTVIYVKNDGANSMDVFPASGDDAGAGLNTAVAVPADGSATFIATVADSTWTNLISTAGPGGTLPAGNAGNDSLRWTGSAWAADSRFQITTIGYQIANAANNQQMAVTVDGSQDITYTYASINDMNVGGGGMSGNFNLNSPLRFASNDSIYMGEKLNADADEANFGQIWVRNDTPNTLMFTDDTGVDTPVVVATGTPVDNQVAVWTDANTVEGDANFTWNGTTLAVTGAATVDTMTLDNNTITASGSLFLAVDGGDSGIDINSNNTISLYTNNVRRFRTDTNGVNITGDLSADTDINLIYWEWADFTDRAQVGFSGNGNFTIDNLVDSGHVNIRAKNSTSATVSILNADPDAGTAIYGTGVEAKRIYGGTVQTTDATQTEVLATDAIGTDQFMGFEVYVIGTETATGDSVYERVFGAIINDGGTTSLVGSNITERTDDAGASGWVITVAADDTADTLTVDVTGEAAHTIDWKCRVELMEV
jgi:hypothetical protein